MNLTTYQIFTPVLIIAFFMLITFGCKESENKGFDRNAMFSNIGNAVALPALTGFKGEIIKLDSVISIFSSTLSQTDLDVAQQQWKATIYAWKKCQVFNVGEVRYTFLNTRIQKWPINTDFIDGFINDTITINEAFIDQVGSTSKGLSVIEYLLFNLNQGDGQVIAELQHDTRRVDYLKALSTNLLLRGSDFVNEWLPENKNYLAEYINGDEDGLQGSLSQQVNEMVAQFETIKNMKLAKPLGLETGGAPDPALLEAEQSEYSLELIKSSLDVLQATFNGGDINSNGLGFDDYLDYLNATHTDIPLSQKINEQFEAIDNAYSQITPPLHQALLNDAASVQQLQDEIQQLLVLIKVDVASNLSVTITFNDNDGD